MEPSEGGGRTPQRVAPRVYSLTLLLVLPPLLALDKDVTSQLPVPRLCGHHGLSLWNDKSRDPRISCFESWSFMITTESKQHTCLPSSTCFCQTLCYIPEKSDQCVKLKQPENAITAPCSPGFVEEEAGTGGNIQPYLTLYITSNTPFTTGACSGSRLRRADWFLSQFSPSLSSCCPCPLRACSILLNTADVVAGMRASSIGSDIWTFGPQWVALSGEVQETAACWRKYAMEVGSESLRFCPNSSLCFVFVVQDMCPQFLVQLPCLSPAASAPPPCTKPSKSIIPNTLSFYKLSGSQCFISAAGQ